MTASAPSWGRFLAELEAAGRRLRARGSRDPFAYPLARSDWRGSSLNFEIFVRRSYPELVVDESDATLALCDGCRRGDAPAPFPAGSSRVCPVCHVTGREDALGRQLALAGLPPAERPAPPGRRRPARAPRGGVIRMRRGAWHLATAPTASGFAAWARRDAPTTAEDPEDEPGEVMVEFGDSRSEALRKLSRSLRP